MEKDLSVKPAPTENSPRNPDYLLDMLLRLAAERIWDRPRDQQFNIGGSSGIGVVGPGKFLQETPQPWISKANVSEALPTVIARGREAGVSDGDIIEFLRSSTMTYETYSGHQLNCTTGT